MHFNTGRLLCFALMLVLVGSGCSEGGRERPAAASATDTSAVRIVENEQQAWGPDEGWRVAPAPAVDIGGMGADADHQLFQVRFARRLSDGTIVLVNAGSKELRFFDLRGAYLFSAGRRGEGPGEFRDPYRLFVLPGDTLLAYDLGLKRVSVLDSHGRFIRSYRLQTPPFPFLLGAFDDGRLVGATNPVYDLGPSALAPRRPATHIVYDRKGEIIDTLGGFEPTTNFAYEYQGVHFGMPLPFAPSTHAAVRGHRFYSGHSGAYEIRVQRRDGELLRVIRKDREPIAVRRADIEGWRAAQVEADESLSPRIREASRRAVEAMLEEVELPETMPAFADIRVDDLDHLWVERYRRPTDPQPVWDVFDPSGRLLGAVETPPSLRIQQVGGDFILAICWDETDLEHVLLYHLEREVARRGGASQGWAPVCAAPGAA